MSRMLSGHPEGMVLEPPAAVAGSPWVWFGTGTNTAFAGPWGISYATNLTPDEATGIGIWTAHEVVQLFVGVGILSGWLEEHGSGRAPPRFIGWLLIVGTLTWMLFAGAYAVALPFAARFLRERRRYRFCFAVAALSCLFSPFGTVLGILTILVLVQDEVRVAFGLAPRA